MKKEEDFHFKFEPAGKPVFDLAQQVSAPSPSQPVVPVASTTNAPSVIVQKAQAPQQQSLEQINKNIDKSFA